MIRYSSEVTISRPAHMVYEALLDPDRYPSWTDMVDVSLADAGDPRVRMRVRFRLAEGPSEDVLELELSELHPNRRVVFQVTEPSLDWRAVATLEPHGAGTRLTCVGELRLHGWRRLLEPLVACELREGEAAELRRLRELLGGRSRTCCAGDMKVRAKSRGGTIVASCSAWS